MDEQPPMMIADARAHAGWNAAQRPRRIQRLAELVADWADLRRPERHRRTPEILDLVEDLTLDTTELGVTLPDGRRVETGVSFEMPDHLWEDTTGADPRWVESVRRDREEYVEWCRDAGVDPADKGAVTSEIRRAMPDIPSFVLVRENVRVA